MQFECYDSEECSGTICSKDHPRLIIEYESLHRVQGSFNYVILDEFRSTASTMVASTNGERIAVHWDMLKHLGNMALKVLFLDADMTVDSCSYKLQDVLMKSRTECRMHVLMAYFIRCDKGAKLSHEDDCEFTVLRKFMEESKRKRTCKCCEGKHAVNDICRIENNINKMPKTLRLASKDEMLLRRSKDAAAGKRIAIACGNVHEAQALDSILS
jgi:Origin of replication binding protein